MLRECERCEKLTDNLSAIIGVNNKVMLLCRTCEPIVKVEIGLRCDFCSKLEAYAKYDAVDMTTHTLPGVMMPSDIKSQSIGEWCACRGCYELIEKDDYEALTLKSVSTLAGPIPMSKGEAYELIKVLHAKFREYRIGKAQIL